MPRAAITVSVPASLLKAYLDAGLVNLSALLQRAMAAELAAAGIDAPTVAEASPRTAAATAARVRRRAEAREDGRR